MNLSNITHIAIDGQISLIDVNYTSNPQPSYGFVAPPPTAPYPPAPMQPLYPRNPASIPQDYPPYPPVSVPGYPTQPYPMSQPNPVPHYYPPPGNYSNQPSQPPQAYSVYPGAVPGSVPYTDSVSIMFSN